MIKIYYFAHPYTCYPLNSPFRIAGEEANYKICCVRSAKLVEAGYIIFSPIAHSQSIHRCSPKLIGQDVQQIWITTNDLIIARTNFNGVILAPEWKDSVGCKHELKLFKAQKDKEVLYYKDIITG